MRSLLLHAHRDDNFDARLQVSLDLARTFNAHVTLLQPVAFNVVIPGDFYGVTAADMAPVVRELAQQFRAEIEPRMAGEDVRFDWVDEIGLADSQMIQHAALTDLAIVGASPPDGDAGSGPSPLAGILAVHCRAPILVVPDHARGIMTGEPAMVCWNGSLEASRALRAAVPLLQAASKVFLVCVDSNPDDDDTFLPALSGAQYLDRHDVKCEIVEVPRGTDSIAHVLRQVAQAREVGLIVMGAYGKPRLLETIFGGVTAEMLKNPDVPILLSH